MIVWGSRLNQTVMNQQKCHTGTRDSKLRLNHLWTHAFFLNSSLPHIQIMSLNRFWAMTRTNLFFNNYVFKQINFWTLVLVYRKTVHTQTSILLRLYLVAEGIRGVTRWECFVDSTCENSKRRLNCSVIAHRLTWNFIMMCVIFFKKDEIVFLKLFSKVAKWSIAPHN
jgi:hypothetical protein